MSIRIKLIGVVLCIAAPAGADVPRYRVDYLGDGWTGTGINRYGDVCGSMSPDGTALLAGVSKGGAPFEFLPLPEGMQSSRAYDINDEGVIVGAVCPNQYVITAPTAAVWRPTPEGYEVEVLEPLPGDPYCAAYAVNNVGDIIGASGFWGWNLSTGVQFTPEGTVPLPEGMLSGDINDERVIISSNRLLDLDTGEVTVYDLPEGNWQGFVAAALNNNNDFCGYILGYSGCSTFPMRYRQSVGWEYLGGCATITSATAINDRGDALSYYYYTASGVTFVPEGYFGLGELIDGSQGEYYVQWGGANGINNNRQIVAAARNGFNGPIGAILMTPMNTGPDCGAIGKLTAKCRDGKLTAKVVSSLPEGAELTLTRNGGDPRTLVINARGKGKVKWTGQAGEQEVCMVECPNIACRAADCL
ncbi:MAG: hypothetical protein BroJett003_17220 [Planctomycetota bacterium]|nr:MAG: hypothetical protein BroJett003_17220 [Planctomycetota bacterium]